MSSKERLAEALLVRQLFTTQDLLGLGVGRGAIVGALSRGELVKLRHGVLATPDAELDPDLEDAVACLTTGGVVYGRTAGARHGLTDDMPNLIEILVPHSVTKVPADQPIRIFRSRIPETFVVGIEERSVLGVPVRMTDRPRTVVDLIVGPIRQHGVAALHTFLGEGGSGDDVHKVAEALGRWDEVEPLVEATLQGMSRTIGR